MTMNRFILLIIITLIGFYPFPEIRSQANILTNQEIKEGWKLLFDGSTTNGWRGFKMKKLPSDWSVIDGCLVAQGTGGGETANDIITVNQYEDFDLSLEWAISPGGNSGVFFHVLEGDYPSAYATGPEYQLIDDAGFPEKLEEWQQSGANYAMHNADKSNKKLKPVGEFNTTRIMVKNNHVTHWLNGEIIVEYDLWSPEWYRLKNEGKWKDYPWYGTARKGYIGLQDHGSYIRFRNIKIKDLTEKGSRLINGKDLQGWKKYGEENWYVDQNVIVGTSSSKGGYGYLATEKEYDDFILRLEFKIEGDGNSGVFFRSQLSGTDIKGWQVEVAPPGQNTGAIYESGGRGWLNEIPDDRENILKPGKWNDLVVFVKDGHIQTWLNSNMMTDIKDETVASGTGVVALQVHSGGQVAVKWRNIYLKTLSK